MLVMGARSVIRRAGLITGVAATAWGSVLLTAGGFTVEVLGTTIRSNNPVNPFVLGALGWLAFFAAGGRLVWVPSDRLVARVCAWTAGGLAATTLIVGLVYATTAVGGSDSYGYASQADLWLEGRTGVEQPWARLAPWPAPLATFSPLGYLPSPRPDREWTIAPTYPPGLPWLMAFGKVLGGQEGMFWVSPIFGALLVLSTYGIGRRLASPVAGLAGAWLVATSPPVLFMLMLPMSDIAAAGAWAAMYCFLIGKTRAGALAAGLCAGLGVAIRPNLVFVGVLAGGWYLWKAWSDRHARRESTLRFALYAAGAAPGAAAIAAANWALNGSPFRTGYGSADQYFSTQWFWSNLSTYAGWFIETHTALPLLGVVALALPLARVWPSAPDRSACVALALIVASVWAFYGFYLEFDAWWYLRFLLPAWPIMMVGFGAIAAALVRRAPRELAAAAVIVVLGLGAFGVRQSMARAAFQSWAVDRHFPSFARQVRSLTGEHSVVLTMQHSGSIRYYAGRLTLRFDLLPRDGLDAAVDWLVSNGVRPYLAVDDWELPYVTAHFEGQRSLDRLGGPPLLEYRGPIRAVLFDLSPDWAHHEAFVFEETYRDLRSVPPVPLALPAVFR